MRGVVKDGTSLQTKNIKDGLRNASRSQGPFSDHSHLCFRIYSMLPSLPWWRSFQVIFKEFDVDESGTISMEELREMTHYLGFMPTRLMLEDSRTAYFDRILQECGWGFKNDGVSICSEKKRSVYLESSSCRGMWSKAPVKSTKVLNQRIGLSFKMHLLLT